MIEKLGDNKQPVRDAATSTIEGVMSVVGSAEVFDQLTQAFGHKKWQLRQQLAILTERTLAGPQARGVPLAEVVPLVAKLLNDQQPAVRTAAMHALVEVYRKVGDRLRRDLEGVRPAQMKQLVEHFDEIGSSGGSGGGAGAGVEPMDSERGGDPAFSDPPAMGGSMGSSSGSSSGRAAKIRGGPTSPRAGADDGGLGDSGDAKDMASIDAARRARPRSSKRRPTGPAHVAGLDMPRSPKKAPPSGVRVYSDKELKGEFEGIAKTLKNMAHDAWTDRQEACQRLSMLVEGGACEFESFALGFGKLLRDPIADALNDLRSAIVKEACAAVSAISRALGDAFEPFAAQYVPILWTKTIITIQVIAESSHACVIDIVNNTQCPKLLRNVIEVGTADRDARLRACCVSAEAISHHSLIHRDISDRLLARADGVPCRDAGVLVSSCDREVDPGGGRRDSQRHG